MVEIIYYTDPLCCWSYAMSPQWDRFCREYENQLKVIYKMGGLLPSWGLYGDEVHSIRKPLQMGPEWLHARHVSGVYIEDRIWVADPPASSFPACIAVKSAQLQSAVWGARYLALARKAVMAEGRNIARLDVLTSLAAEMAGVEAGFDLPLFLQDLNGRGVAAFRDDWKEVRYQGINRFPTFVIRNTDHRVIMLRGYQGYEELKKALMAGDAAVMP
jgi:predicted DsbA family dithiol-disulfide isomerase